MAVVFRLCLWCFQEVERVTTVNKLQQSWVPLFYSMAKRSLYPDLQCDYVDLYAHIMCSDILWNVKVVCGNTINVCAHCLPWCTVRNTLHVHTDLHGQWGRGVVTSGPLCRINYSRMFFRLPLYLLLNLCTMWILVHDANIHLESSKERNSGVVPDTGVWFPLFEDSGLLGCDTVSLGLCFPVFWRKHSTWTLWPLKLNPATEHHMPQNLNPQVWGSLWNICASHRMFGGTSVWIGEADFCRNEVRFIPQCWQHMK
jgi:hypothetical protein